MFVVIRSIFLDVQRNCFCNEKKSFVYVHAVLLSFLGSGCVLIFLKVLHTLHIKKKIFNF